MTEIYINSAKYYCLYCRY